MPIEQQAFDVNIANLIEVLRESLYSDARVALRELLANARDSLLQRWGLGSNEGRIEVRLDSAGVLTVADNGLGMGPREIREGLACVAGSFTRVARREVHDSEDVAGWLSGYFGLGFFASFMLADGIQVLTRRPGGAAYLWRCFGGRAAGDASAIPSSWTLEETEWRGEGTEVSLFLKRGFLGELTSPVAVERLVRLYGDLIEFPIHVSGRLGPVNLRRGPWLDESAGEHDYLEFLKRRGVLADGQDAITVIPLRGQRDIGGVLCLADPAEPEGFIELHSRRLYVNRDRAYAGPRLGFLRGVVDARPLRLTLSRESLIAGPELEWLRNLLRDAFLRHLRWLAGERQGSFRRVIAVYGAALKRAAVEDDDLLDVVGGELPMPVGLGRQEMPMGQLLKRYPRNSPIRFLDDPQAQAQYATLLDAQGIPVVNASDRLNLAVLHKYAARQGREVARADADPGIPEVHEAGWEQVERLLTAVDDTIQLKQARLPENVPALFKHEPVDMIEDLFREAHRQHGDDLPPQLRVAELLHQLMSRGRRRRRTLYLNIQHPLLLALRRACEARIESRTLAAVARGLIAAARLYTEHLEPAQRAEAYQAQSQACSALLEQVLSGRRSRRWWERRVER